VNITQILPPSKCHRCFSHLGSYRIAGNFRGRKPSQISWFESHSRKFSLRNLGMSIHTYSDFAFHECFFREMIISYRSAKAFSLECFLLYGIDQCFLQNLTAWYRINMYVQYAGALYNVIIIHINWLIIEDVCLCRCRHRIVTALNVISITISPW
jgi:hypothetical protein